MIPLSARSRLAIAAVLDVALHARPIPVPATAIAARHGLKPRQLETVLQALVRAGLLKSLRGPRGGYELARERRRISLGDVVRAVDAAEDPGSRIAGAFAGIVEAALAEAGRVYLGELDRLTIEALCRKAAAGSGTGKAADFTI